jgi:TetR/AcrR family transcriptional regulator
MPEVEDQATEGAKRIAHVAAHLFAQKGFQGVSMAALAREAGVGKATIFHHFPSKEELYFFVLKQACGEVAAYLRQSTPPDDDPDHAFQDFARFNMRHLGEYPEVARLVMRELMEGDSQRLRALTEEVSGGIFERLQNLVREGQAAGLYSQAHDPALVAGILVSMQLFFAQTGESWHHLPGVNFADQPERFTEGLMSLLLDGLRTRDSVPATRQGEGP